MYALCESCLKRLGIKRVPKKCELCGNIFDKIDQLTNFTYEAEFSTFNVGIKLAQGVVKKEKEIMKNLSLSGEKTLKRELLSILREKLKEKFNKDVQFENPDVVFIFDLETLEMRTEPRSLYIRGRYNKYVRDIPQTKWYCKKCRGRGCPYCNFKGKMYETSVEEIIGAVVLRYAECTEEKFHGAGREDINVRMLGDGRPFVIEIINPKIRSVELKKIESEINKDKRIVVRELELSDKREVVRLKQGKFSKTYLAHLNRSISDDELGKLSSLKKIHQRTPQRVVHRRADKTRIRKIYKVERKNSNCLKICCEGGLYVKELITGDDGRTTPNVSSVLQKNMECVSLDVVKIHDR
ncbi:MAG: tRNA pseudouridine(54/55) synthase Pus10 [Euryarchaeota archaeon]|nr:tRNA pseudouridine(54/55) synthase Pus10 [Euryarchaeota archaeon]